MKVAVVITHPLEAVGMLRWALLFSRPYPALTGEADASENQVDLTVLYGENLKVKNLQEEAGLWQTESNIEVDIDFKKIDTTSPPEVVDHIVDTVADRDITLLIVGKNRYSDADEDAASEQSRALSRELYDRAPCDTLLMRLGSNAIVGCECSSVLVPSAGGPHSLTALRLAHSVVEQSCGTMTPLYVERGISDADGEAVGELVLLRVLREAGIDAHDDPRVNCRVSTSNRVDAGIRAAAESGDYDLLIVGSPNSGSLKRKLFGTVPDRLLAGEDAMTVAAIRARRSTAQRISQRFERFLRLRIPQLEREERVALFEKLQTGSRWNFDFMTLITLATAIAALGLVVDSTAVVIGAMLVAPLMTPLLGAGLALVQGNLPLMRNCLQAVAFGFLAAILVGVLVGLVAPLTQLTSELGARGSVRLEDMLVAFLSGVAASYCIARPGLSSALAGVAIAAALVPPIATVGISLALQEAANAWGAAKLFAVNVVAIVLGAAINFYLAGIRSSGAIVWVRRTAVLLILCATLLVVPMFTVLANKFSERLLSSRSTIATLQTTFEKILLENSSAPDSVYRVTLLPLDQESDHIIIRCQLTAARHPDDKTLQKMAQAAEKQLQQPVDLELITTLTTRVTTTVGD